jgi:hypothetical protein
MNYYNLSTIIREQYDLLYKTLSIEELKDPLTIHKNYGNTVYNKYVWNHIPAVIFTQDSLTIFTKCIKEINEYCIDMDIDWTDNNDIIHYYISLKIMDIINSLQDIQINYCGYIEK